MADLPQQQTIDQYVADGLTADFSYVYLVPREEDIDVFVTPDGQSANDQADIQLLGTNYIVTDVGNINGGTVQFLPGSIPSDQSIVTLSRAVKAAIETNYADPKTINGINLDDSFQLEMLVAQQNQTKFDDRSLRYEISSFIPDSSGKNVVPILDAGYIWIGSASGGVAAALLDEDPDCSTLRSELANEDQNTDGAGLVGYYDESRSLPTTVRDQLNEYGENTLSFDGSSLIGYYDKANSIETNVASALDILTNSQDLLVATGSANVIVLTPGIPITAYAAGQKFRFKAISNNSATVTIDVSGLGPVAANFVLPNGLSPLFPNQIVQDGIYDVIYDGSVFQLENPSTSVVLSSQVTFQPSSSQVIGAAGGKVEFDAITFDTNNWWNQPSHRFIPTLSGKYSIYAAVFGLAPADSQAIEVYKNGSLYKFFSQSANVGGPSDSTPSGAIGTVIANGTTDYFEIFWNNGSGSNVTLGNPPNSDKFAFFEIKYEGS